MKKLFLIILFCPTLLFSQWVQQTLPPNIDIVACIDFINTNTGVAGGSEYIIEFEGRAIYTTNSGTNWIQAQIPDSSRGISKVQFVNSNTGYMTGAYNCSYSYTSKNKSKPKHNTQKIYLPTQIRKYYERLGMTGAEENYRGLFLKTTNRGLSWFTLDNLPTNVYSLTGMYFFNQNTGFVTAGFNHYSGILDGILRTTNGGLSWNTLTTVDSVKLNNIFSPDGNLIVATGWKRNYGLIAKGTILRSSNGGVNWTEQYFQEVSSFRDLHFINSLTGYLAGSDTTIFGLPQAAIYQTTNSGMNWHNVHKVNHICQYYGIEISSSGIGFAVGDVIEYWNDKTIPNNPIISRTSNFGNNWTDNFLTDTSIILHGISTANQDIWFVCGSSFNFDALIFKTTNGGVGIQPISNEIPDKFSLYQNYPNPFNPSTKIRFDLHKTTHAKIIVFDVLGRELVTLVDEELQAGSFEVDWNGSNYPSGVYFYRLETKEYSQTKKMLMMK